MRSHPGRLFCIAVGVAGIAWAPGPMAATTLTVSKSGNDVVLSWTSPGAAFDGARATDGPFANTTTLFTAFGGASYTYFGAVSNALTLEFFDISDPTESNRGGNWNGGVLPPPPPVINPGGATNIGSLFIGSTGTIDGSGFSTVPGSNTVCFKGGVCTPAIASSATQIQFVTPPGALTGPVTVTVGTRTSAAATATVTLEDPASGWLIRTIGFSRQDKSYWMTGSSGAVNSLYRVYYNDAAVPKRWVREDRGGAASGSLLYCSTKTGRTGKLFCVPGTGTVGNNTTYVAETSPPGNLAACATLITAGNNNLRGAAVDPNPGAVAGRDVFYVALAIDENSEYLIRKMFADCSGVAETDWGDRNWFGSWNAIVGMAVDPVTGDLYVAARTEVYRISTSQVVTLVKGGFTSVNGIDIRRGGPTDPGLLLVADGGTSNTVKAVALDNTSATPITVASAAALRAATFGATVSGGPWLASNVNRVAVINNNGSSGAVGPLRPYPLIDVTPAGPFRVRISSPTAEQAPSGQSRVRESLYMDSTYSLAFTELRYQDGLSRLTCAWTGDPGKGILPEDPDPTTPTNCDKPQAVAAADCDNRGPLIVGGPGSFTDSGNPLQSCKTCGGTGTPCRWDFRATNRFAGDNYKVYFALDVGATEYPGVSDVYTAGKHLHLERDRMCAVGGILFADYGATGQCGAVNQPACCGTGGQLPCNQIAVYAQSNVQVGDSVVAFDEINRYENAGYLRTVTGGTSNANGSITLTLNSALPRSYWSSTQDTQASPTVPNFVNGHSGGVCVPLSGFFEADLSDIEQAFVAAAVDFHAPAYGLDGSNVVPYLWPGFFNIIGAGSRPCSPLRFSRIWNSHFGAGPDILGCPANDAPDVGASRENNWAHIIPASDTVTQGSPAGFSGFRSAFSYVFENQIAQDCGGTNGDCTTGKQAIMRRWTSAHETGHQFVVNYCTSSLGFHDARNAWCGQSSGSCVVAPATHEACLMAGTDPPPPDELDMRADGVDQFCKEDLRLGDPNCTGPDAGRGAIRTMEDPQ